MINKRQFIAVLLSVVFMQYFAGTTFFVHCHKLPTRIIVHSHPFPNKANNHSENQELCLDLLSQAVCITTPQINAPDFIVDIVRTVGGVLDVSDGQRGDIGIMPLRAPPAC